MMDAQISRRFWLAVEQNINDLGQVFPFQCALCDARVFTADGYGLLKASESRVLAN